MPIPLNIKNIPAHHLCCGNIILYLDQLWKVIEIKLSGSYIHFQAEREINLLHQDSSTNTQKDVLKLTRIPDITITVIE